QPGASFRSRRRHPRLTLSWRGLRPRHPEKPAALISASLHSRFGRRFAVRRGIPKVLMYEGNGHAALSDRGRDALHWAEAHVAARKDARNARLEKVGIAVERPA